MATKNEIIAAIQAAADASGNNDIRISLGAPGNNLKNVIGQTKPTGQAWQPEPKTWPLIAEGLADWLDANLKAKLNELIGEYNQLRTDYNNGVVPTTANAVTPLP